MFLEFRMFPQENSQLEDDDLQLNFDQEKLRTRTLSALKFEDDLFYVCQCADMYYSHELCIGKCNSCPCMKFVWPEICVELEFTIADLFEEDFPEHSERDSPQWWMEFSRWYEKNKEFL